MKFPLGMASEQKKALTTIVPGGSGFNVGAAATYQVSSTVPASPLRTLLVVCIYTADTVSHASAPSGVWNGITGQVASYVQQGAGAAWSQMTIMTFDCPPSGVDVTANASITYSAAMVRAAWCKYTIPGFKTQAPFDQQTTGATNASPAAINCNVPAGGVLIGAAGHYSAAGGARTYAWSGITEDYDFVIGAATGQGASMAHDVFPSAQTVNVGIVVTASPTYVVQAVASFQ